MGKKVSLSVNRGLAIALSVGLLVGGMAGYVLEGFLREGNGHRLSSTPVDYQLPDNRATGGGSPGDQTGSTAAPENKGRNKVRTASFDTEGDPSIGSADAPVVIAYWGDFQCPYCRRFELETFPKIVEGWVKTREVRIVFKDLPIIGRGSRKTAMMSQCVWRQVREKKPSSYWDWHRGVFAAQVGGKQLSKGLLFDIAENAGIDIKKVRKCLEKRARTLQSEVQKDMREARAVGIDGTPAFVVYGTGSERGALVRGAQPFSRFESVIKSELGGEAGSDAGSKVSPGDFQGDKFSGEITNENVPEGVYPGEVAYDRNCHDVGGGLTGCNAGIRTQEFGLVDFYYEHDMDAKPCLAPPQEVVLVVRGDEVFVQRKR